MRLRGASYEEIARAGGGIASSVKALRAADEDDARPPIASAPRRVDGRGRRPRSRSNPAMGWTCQTSANRCAPRGGSAQERPVSVRRTYLGAHALPPGIRGRQDRIYRYDRDPDMMPALAREGLVDAVDGFCEGIAFSPEEIAKSFLRGARPRAAGQAPRRSTLQPSRRCAGRALSARFPPIISNIPMKRARPRWLARGPSP